MHSFRSVWVAPLAGALALLALSGAGCEFPFPSDENGGGNSPTGAGAGSTSSMITASGGAGGVGQGAGGGGVGQGGGGMGGQGGSLPTTLMGDDALVVRYFINQNDSGSGGAGGGGLTLHDAATDPLHLPVTLDGMQPALGSDGSHWGLSWTETNSAGLPTAPITGTKLVTGATSLNGKDTATIELVLEVTTVHAAGSYLLNIATAPAVDVDDSFSLLATSPSTVQFLWNPSGGGPGAGTTAGAWHNFDLSTRKVVHLVLDTTSNNGGTPVRLYVSGTLVDTDASVTVTAPGTKTIGLAPMSDALTLGNRPGGGRSFVGTLYYAALYYKALTAAEVDNNSAFLANNDDGT